MTSAVVQAVLLVGGIVAICVYGFVAYEAMTKAQDRMHAAVRDIKQWHRAVHAEGSTSYQQQTHQRYLEESKKRFEDAKNDYWAGLFWPGVIAWDLARGFVLAIRGPR